MGSKRVLSRLAFAQPAQFGILPRFFTAVRERARARAGFRMEPYDIVMLVVLVGTSMFGAWKGMAWQVASSASLVLSYGIALRFSTPLAPHFGQQAPLNRFIAMAVLYAATSLIIWVAFRIVAGFINRVRLREFDRQMASRAKLSLQPTFASDFTTLLPDSISSVNKALLAITLVQITLISMILNGQEEEYLGLFEVR